jgi:hypothetical protein
MQINVSLDGAAPVPITIRNPGATIANLRAAVAVTLKLGANSFEMFLDSSDKAISDETPKLTAVGVKDGSTVAVKRKRGRDGEAVVETTTVAQANPAQRPPRSEAAVAGRTRAPMEQLLAALHAGRGLEAADDDDFDDDDEEDDDEETDFESMSGSLADDAMFEGLGVDDEEGSESESDTRFGPEEVELLQRLLALPNIDTLKNRFRSDPRAAMADIQATSPELFNLIARHTQFYLNFVNDLESDDGESHEEDGDVQEHGAAAGHVPGASSSAGRAAAASSSPSQPAGATAARGSQRPLTDADERNIQELMQLGFPRDKCLEAYIRCGRNPNRAAGALFDTPPE